MSSAPSPKPKLETIAKLLEDKGYDAPVASIGDFLKAIQTAIDRWQEEDWNKRERDDDEVLNNTRIVGQVWFRGHVDWTRSLRPGLYRETTRQSLGKNPGSPTPAINADQHLFNELFELEHELRIDFRSYGHLLNEANQASTGIDWYFLMQHHGLPTRLLDWTTNALAALFFALDECRLRRERSSVPVSGPAEVAVWMADAYWLGDTLSDEWSSPLLPWSEDAERYIPPLETLIAKMDDSISLLPGYAMPIEPPAMHPRVAAQEGRFIIFGRTQDLLEERIRLQELDDCKGIEELRLAQVRLSIADIDSVLRALAQLGVSRRTLFPDLTGLADFVRWKHFHKVAGYTLKP